MFRFRRQLSISYFLLLASFAASAAPAAKWSAQWEPTKLVNGSPVLFRVSAPLQLIELRGNFLGQEISFRSSAACHCWYAFAGVSLATKPGTYTLHVEGKSKGGKGCGRGALSYQRAQSSARICGATQRNAGTD
jgi:hypothetical protein